MSKKIKTRKRNNREPNLEEWHELLTWVVGENDLAQGALEYFLRHSQTGNAYLEGAKRLRPTLDIGESLALDEVILTHDAGKLLSKLITEPRFGTDPEFLIWKDIWKESTRGDSDEYEYAIDISYGLEARSASEAEKTRLQQVRSAIKNEIRLERYVFWRRQITRKDEDL